MAQPVTVVDSFTDVAFGGNPAGVCLLEVPAAEAWMRSVAAELNLSETAFVVPRPDGDFDLRWFTPTTEVDLCGHATLAAAHVLGRPATFHTRSGPLATGPAAGGGVEMDFPITPTRPVPDPPDWSAALGLPPGRIVAVREGSGWVVAELARAADVRAVVPDRAAIVALGGSVIVVAPGDGDGVDSVTRVFVPGAGIDEDPVTGSAHCVIAPWLAERTGRTTFTGHQASARGGTVGMAVAGERVTLTGRAVTVMTATLHVDPPPA